MNEPNPVEAVPFECDNCDYKPTIQEVLDHKGDCPKCGDTVRTFTVDAAIFFTSKIQTLERENVELRAKFEFAIKDGRQRMGDQRWVMSEHFEALKTKLFETELQRYNTALLLKESMRKLEVAKDWFEYINKVLMFKSDGASHEACLACDKGIRDISTPLDGLAGRDKV